MAVNLSTNVSAGNGTGFSGLSFPISAEDIKLIATVFFSFISSVGTFGNFFVILTLLRWPDMRTPCNLFIANIAFADLIISLIMAPLRVIEQYARGWIFGEVLCYVVAPLQDCLVSVSVFSHTAIALERYRAILSPFKPRMNKRKVKIAILLIWIGCYLGVSFPLLFFVVHERRGDIKICMAEDFPKEHFYIFALYLVVVFISVPLLLQTLSYTMIIMFLKNKDAVQDHRETCNGVSAQIQIQTTRRREKTKRRLIKMLIVLMLIFQLCYLPRGCIMLIFEFGPPSILAHNAFAYVNIVTMLLFYVKHIINPLILFCMSRDFKNGFTGLCRCYTLGEFSVELGGSSGKRPATNKTKL